jgi:hypothetical protein
MPYCGMPSAGVVEALDVVEIAALATVHSFIRTYLSQSDSSKPTN